MTYLRDYAVYIAIFGIFSFSWFGWAQANPKKQWRKYIGFASGFSLIVGGLGIYLSIANWNEPSALNNRESFGWYLVIVGLEVLIAIIGAIILSKKGLIDFISPFICFIIAIHFFPLAVIFQDLSLHILGFLLVPIPLLAVRHYKRNSYGATALTGIGSGTVLLIFALFNIIRFFIAYQM